VLRLGTLGTFSSQGAIFFEGGACAPKICHFLLKANFFQDKKPRFYGCLFAQLKGRTGEPPPAPEGA